MNQVTKATLNLLKLFARFTYFIPAVLILLALTYLFGHHLLIGSMKGSDSAFAFHNASWYLRWWPRIPIWYPVQGGGFSLTLSYAVVPSFLAILVHQATSLDLHQTMRLLELVATFFTSLGLYVFCAWRLKHQTIGLMAAVFYLLLPTTWYWSITIGLFAFTISLSLIPWVFSLFDYWITSWFKGSPRKTIIAFFLAALTFGLAAMFHIIVGFILGLSLPIYGLVRGWTLGKKALSITPIIQGLIAACLPLVTGLLLVSFWFLPYWHYNNLANREHLAADPIELLQQFHVPPLTQFPYIIGAFAIIGTLIALARRKAALATAIITFIFLYWSGLPQILPVSLLEKLRLIFSVSQRAIALTYVFLPVVAAFGIYSLVELIVKLPFLPLNLIKNKTGHLLKRLSHFPQLILTISLSLIIFIIGTVALESPTDSNQYGPKPKSVALEQQEEHFPGYYFRPVVDDLPLPLTSSNLNQTYAYQWLNSHPLQSLAISSTPAVGEPAAEKLVSLLPPLDQFTRVGLTGYEGLGLQAFGNFTPASTLSQYMYKGSLMHGMRGYAEKAFFDNKNSTHTPATISNLARWLGYQYVILKPARDDDSHYSPPDWDVDYDQGGLRIYQFADPQGLATLTSRPQVLVIGKAINAYDSVFRTANAGALPYSNAWLVEGKANVDDYSLDDLQQFDGLILHGYSYGRQSRAFSLLDQYVKNGGQLFIDTGWQFIAQDWQLDSAPNFLPVDSTTWSTDLSQEYPLSPSQAESLGLKTLSFDRGGKSWDVSQGVGLKNWAVPILQIQGHTLIAGGQYGQGQVIWSGLNLFGYLGNHQYDQPLVDMATSIFSQLFPEYSEPQPLPVSLSRSYPDKIDITLLTPLPEGATLLWREAYSPQWQITLDQQTLPAYRAGPGFTLINIPPTSQPANIILNYHLGWSGIVGKLISGLTLIFFILLLIIPRQVTHFLTRPFSQVKHHWDTQE